MASEIRVNTINNSSGLGTITISDTGHVFSGITTIGSVTINGGTVTGNVTGDVTGNVSGIVTSTGISTFSDTVNVGAGKSIRLYGDSSGYSEIVAAAGSASTTFTLPANGGSASQYLQTDGSGTLSWQTVSVSNLTRGVGAATTSGTSVDFTSLPTGIRKITLILDRVSVNGANNISVRLSTGETFATTGYESQSMRIQDASTSASTADTASFALINNDNASREWTGSFTWHNITGNVWVMSGNCNSDSTARAIVSGGRVDLGGVLDGIRLYSPATFDNGQINIFYEV